MSHDHGEGFSDVTRLDAALAQLSATVGPHGRRESLAIGDAGGRVLATPVDAGRDVPHYDRAAMDGYALRASETHEASERAPRRLSLTDGPVGAGEARPVHTGSAIPAGADAIVPIEDAQRVDDNVELTRPVTVGEDVAPAGEDVVAGEQLFDFGHRLQPADLGLCLGAGACQVTVADRPTVAVVPTGDELVAADPAPGEMVETNGLTVSRLVERWGGAATHGSVVPDDEPALRAAIDDALDHDLVVTLGGSSVGSRDLVPDVVEDMGELLVHGVALQPGHPVGLGTVADTPVLVLPGYPVSCLVTATRLLRPAIAWSMGAEPPGFVGFRGRLTRTLESKTGVRTFARVRTVESAEGENSAAEQTATGGEEPDPLPSVEPLRTSGAGVLSSVTEADGWVVVPESSEGYEAGTVVDVEDWAREP